MYVPKITKAAIQAAAINASAQSRMTYSGAGAVSGTAGGLAAS